MLSHNRSLNGLLYKLNSKYDNNKTLLQQENNGLDSEDELEFNKKEKNILPGNGSNPIPQVKINCVQFSNTNRSFAVGTTEGIYIYSLDKSLSFNKLSINIEVKLKDALDAWEQGNYIKGIIYSIYLKKIDLLDKYFDSIPISKVQLIVNKIPFSLVSPLLDYLCNDRIILLYFINAVNLLFNFIFFFLLCWSVVQIEFSLFFRVSFCCLFFRGFVWGFRAGNYQIFCVSSYYFWCWV